jgi:anaerobic selenocysteine-containing dehydrogenase
VLPRFDPARVSAITGVSVPDLERFATMYGRAWAPFIRLGEGMSRCTQGGQAIRAVALLPGVVGAYAKTGGGALLMTAAAFGVDSSRIRKPSGPATTRSINHSRLGDALLTMKDPPIRALFVASNNPAVTCPDASAVRRGLAREDLFSVVHDPFLSDTARYADIVLPAASYLEGEDVLRAYGTYYLQFGKQVVEPRGEAWSNRRLAQELARRLVTDGEHVRLGAAVVDERDRLAVAKPAHGGVVRMEHTGGRTSLAAEPGDARERRVALIIARRGEQLQRPLLCQPRVVGVRQPVGHRGQALRRERVRVELQLAGWRREALRARGRELQRSCLS